MKTTVKRLLAPLAAVAGLSGMALEAEANPAFARQMDMNCMGCHSQSIPMLNSFGRQFKLSGFTMTAGDKSMITGGDLGIAVPLAINAGIGFKSTYTDTDKANGRSELAIPAGASIMIGGKVSEHMGANVLFNQDGIVHLQAAYSRPVGSANAGLTYSGTMGHGAFIAVESHNTGLHKELAMFDSSARTNAVQSRGLGLGKGPTTGLTAFVGGKGLKVAAGVWALGFNSNFNDKSGISADSLGSLYRVTYDAPAMGGWNLSVGAFGIDGTTRGTTADIFEAADPDYVAKLNTMAPPWWDYNTVYDHEVSSNGFDLQLQGGIGGMDTQVVVSHVAGYEYSLVDTDPATPFPTAVMMDSSATSLEMQVMPNSAWGIRLGYMTSDDELDDRKDSTSTSFGVNYNYADNVRFSLEQTSVEVDTEFGQNVDNDLTQLTAVVVF